MSSKKESTPASDEHRVTRLRKSSDECKPKVNWNSRLFQGALGGIKQPQKETDISPSNVQYVKENSKLITKLEIENNSQNGGHLRSEGESRNKFRYSKLQSGGSNYKETNFREKTVFNQSKNRNSSRINNVQAQFSSLQTSEERCGFEESRKNGFSNNDGHLMEPTSPFDDGIWGHIKNQESVICINSEASCGVSAELNTIESVDRDILEANSSGHISSEHDVPSNNLHNVQTVHVLDKGDTYLRNENNYANSITPISSAFSQNLDYVIWPPVPSKLDDAILAPGFNDILPPISPTNRSFQKNFDVTSNVFSSAVDLSLHRDKHFQDHAFIKCETVPYCEERILSTSDHQNTGHSGKIIDASRLSIDSYCSSSIASSDCTEDCDVNEYCKDQIDAITKLIEKVKNENCFNNHNVVKNYEKKINNLLKKEKRGYMVTLYGSCLANYAVKTSNINFKIFSDAENFNVRYLKIFSSVLERECPDFHVSFEESTKFGESSITCVDGKCPSTAVIRYIGLDCSIFMTSNCLKAFMELDGRMHPLVIAFRYWAQLCAIEDGDNGRLHPVCIVVLLIHFLQQREPPVLPVLPEILQMKEECKFESKNTESIGELWLSLFEYYSNIFNWKQHVITIWQKHPYEKAGKYFEASWIAVEAIEQGRNLAKSVINQDVSQYIQMCFSQTYQYFSLPTSMPSCDFLNENSVETGYSNEIGEYDYSFHPINFIEDAMLPTFCPDCEDLGYTCEYCIEEGSDTLPPLPAMTPRFLISVNECLLQVYDAYALTDDDVYKRTQLVSKLEHYLKSVFKNVRLTLIGSSTNGFGFKNSDLDICMTVGKRKLVKQEGKRILQKLCGHLRKNKEFSFVFGLYSAKVPLVQFLHVETKLRGDISLYNELAVYNTELLYTYSCIDKRAKILGCAMKLLAKNACIADTTQKSLSSYSYVLLVIHYLQNTEPPVLPVLQELGDIPEYIVDECNVAFFSNLKNLGTVWASERNTQNIGELWLGLLKYYTDDFNYGGIISIRKRKTSATECKMNKLSRLFNIEDPFITQKNLGSVMSSSMSTYTFKTLLRARKIFGTPIDKPPPGFQSFQDYFFHTMILTDGRIRKAVTCETCGKLGHSTEACKRLNLPPFRGYGHFNTAFRK